LHNRRSPSAAADADEHWSRVQRIARELDKILDTTGPRRSAIARAAAELQLSTRQIYNLLGRYREDRTVTVLLPRTGTSRRKRLPGPVEEIIEVTLREQWLILEAPPLTPVVAEVRANELSRASRARAQ
jgi:putative transposase